MNYSFKSHRLSNAEKLWLQEVAQSKSFDARRVKVKLFGKIPVDFNPRTIDSRLFVNDQLTLIGRWHVEPDSPLFEAVDKVISAIRTSIFANPGVESFTATDIALLTKLDEELVARALHEAGQLGSFYSGGTYYLRADGQPNNHALASIQLTAPNAYDEYLRYKNLDELLERVYIEREPSQVSSGMSAFVPFGTTTSTGILLANAVVEQKEIKRNTAFVLMAMDRTRPDLEDVYNTIKEVCKEFRIVAYRADAIEHQDSITERILEEIRACEYLVADLSLERPNVYYEVGYAHAVNKKPILYRKAGTRLHFDLAVHNVPEYENNTELRNLLRKRLGAITGREPKSN